MTRHVSPLVLLAACSDYDLNKFDAPARGGEADTAALAPDSGEPEPEEDEDDDEVPEDDVELGTATAIIYLNTEDTLYAWEPDAGLTRVGEWSDPSVRMTDIAVDMNGNMVGIATHELYEIDAATATLTWACTLEDYANGLTFISDGRLIAAGAGLSVVDRDTCAATPLTTESGFRTAGDVVGIPGERLLWTVNGDAGDGLVEVDPDTGATALVGHLGVSGLWGVGYADGQLHGFSVGGQAVVIDPDTAAVSDVTALDGEWWGATTNPVRW